MGSRNNGTKKRSRRADAPVGRSERSYEGSIGDYAGSISDAARTPSCWTEGLMIFAPDAMEPGEKLYVPAIPEAVWKAARRLLDEGYTLAFVAAYEEACNLAAAVAEHCGRCYFAYDNEQSLLSFKRR